MKRKTKLWQAAVLFAVAAGMMAGLVSCKTETIEMNRFRIEREPAELSVVEAPGIVLQNVPGYENEMNVSELPKQWDSRLVGKCPTVRDQGNLGTCWASAAIEALEAARLPENTEPLSVDHMVYHNGYGRDASEGGTDLMALAYLTNWKGPVTEAEDPYNDGMTNDEAEPVCHLQQARFLTEDVEAVKRAVLKNGCVQSSMYADEAMLTTPGSTTFFNAETNSYYYNGSETQNHDVLIVGWDDDYPADAFVLAPPADGAFLCLNSWGDTFGDNGFFYISYFDIGIMKRPLAFDVVDDPGVYDHIYYWDELGFLAQAGFDDSTAYGGALFTPESDQIMAAAGFYAATPGTVYELYAGIRTEGAAEMPRIDDLTKVASGESVYEGYYTVEFDRPIEVNEGQTFALVLMVSSEKTGKPLAVESSSAKIAVTTQPGKTYVSSDGIHFTDADTLGCTVCLKAYSKTLDK